MKKTKKEKVSEADELLNKIEIFETYLHTAHIDIMEFLIRNLKDLKKE